MSNISNIPLEDWFSTSLTRSWDWSVWTIYVASTPSFTFPSWITTYIVVNPWKSNMQLATINAYNSSLKTMTVSSITLNKWASVASTANPHSVWSKVIISDNYQFWADIISSLNSKVDWDTQPFPSYTTSWRDALTASNWMVIYNSTTWELNQYISWSWSAISAWSTQPNASTILAGKVEIPTQAQFDAGAITWETGALLVSTPEYNIKQIYTSASKSIMVWADSFWISDSADSWKIKQITLTNLQDSINISSQFYNLIWAFWNWSDWDVTINSWTTTLVRDMYYNNLTITSPWILNPNWFKIFAKLITWNGTITQNNTNNWTNWANAPTSIWWALGGTWWSVLNQWSLWWNLAWWNGWNWNLPASAWDNWLSTSWNPTYLTSNWANWWSGWAGNSSAWWTSTWWTSTRWDLYNSYINLTWLLHPASIPSIPAQYKIGWGWAGWWGGWWSGAWTTWYWWGGWWAWWEWGIIWISSKVFNFTWLMTATWWNGWNWGAWSSANGANGWWGGWWAWWRWGLIYLISSLFTAIWTQTLTWWTWWTGWAPWVWWSWGVAWSNWSAWTIWALIQITLT